MFKIPDWNRETEGEKENRPRVWKDHETGKEVVVQQFTDGTWDTFLNDTLIENFDSVEDAIERAELLINGS